MPYMYSGMQNKLSKTRDSPLESMGQIISSRCPIYTFTCSFFNQLMLITGSHFFGKTHHRLASKLLISFLVPKNHKINAFGSHLYMNLKKNDFWIC